MTIDTTQFNQLVQEVSEALRAGSQGVGEIEVATSLSGLVSLPALRLVGMTETVVEAPLELLSIPATEAAIDARKATDEAIVAAVNAAAAADLSEAERKDLAEIKLRTIAAGSAAAAKGDKALEEAVNTENATLHAMQIASDLQTKLEQAQVIILSGSETQEVIRLLNKQLQGEIIICARTREEAREAILHLRELQRQVADSIREAYQGLDEMKLSITESKSATELARNAIEKIESLSGRAEQIILEVSGVVESANRSAAQVGDLVKDVLFSITAADLAAAAAGENAELAGASAEAAELVLQDVISEIDRVKGVTDKAEQAVVNAIASVAGADAAGELATDKAGKADASAEAALVAKQEADIAATNALVAEQRAIESTEGVNEAIEKAVAAAGGADDARDAATDATTAALSAAESVEKVNDLSAQAAEAAIAAAERADTAGGHANEQAKAATLAADRSNVLSDNPAKIIDDEWHKYNEETGEYVAIGIQAKGNTGSSFRVVGNYNTYDLLLAAVPDGAGVDGVYGIGEAPPYSYYAWTLKDTVWGWNAQGMLQGQRGESAFEGAVRMLGYEGTEQEYAVSPIQNAKLALDAAKKAGDDTADFLKSSAKSVTDTVVRMTELSDNPMKIVEGVWYKYNEEAGEYVSTGVRAIPIDWRVRDLDHEPTAADVTYHDEESGLNIAYPVGAEVRVRDGDEYLFYKLYDLLDGVASWDESGGGGALKQNVFLTGADHLTTNIIRQGYLNQD